MLLSPSAELDGAAGHIDHAAALNLEDRGRLRVELRALQLEHAVRLELHGTARLHGKFLGGDGDAAGFAVEGDLDAV